MLRRSAAPPNLLRDRTSPYGGSMRDHGRSAQEIRAELDHPIVDADGHIIEYWPELDRYFREEGISGGIADFLPTANFDGSELWARLSPEERERERAYRGPWWAFPGDARDIATATAPRLLYDRLPELGIDFAVCFPSVGLQIPAQRDETVRRRGSRAYNRYAAEIFAGLGNRLTPVAIIPTVTPEEAIEELDLAVDELGFRAALIGGFAPRGFGEGPHAFWIDGLGLDSVHDYDPLWRRLIEKNIAPSLHSGSMGWSGRRSPSNFSYNHMGNFAGANEASAKSLFFGGVLHRFPELRVAFLEGGVSWAVQMLIGLVEHFEKRGREGLRARDPKNIEGDLYDRLIAEHCGSMTPVPGLGNVLRANLDTPEVFDDFAAAGIESIDDIVRQITTQCFFGCEADDPLAGMAMESKRLPQQCELAPIFSSDIGHWDVAHMHEVIPELEDHLEHGWLSTRGFRAFTCDNTIRLYTEANPEFFVGTSIESYVNSR